MASLSKSHRPQIPIALQRTDYILEILAAFGLLMIGGLVVFAYQHLPAQVPMHLGLNGQVTQMGPKNSLWVLTFIGLLLYLLMSAINLRPDRFNYIVDITPQNAEQYYRRSTRVVRLVKALTMFMFAFLTNHILQFGQPGASGLNFTIFVLLMAVTIGVALFDAFKSTAQQ